MFFKIQKKIKIINIKVENICDRIENIESNIFFANEIFLLEGIINLKIFEEFEKFTFNGPNDTYLIYDKNKKLLIIRFGDYKKYKLAHESIIFCQDCDRNYCNNTNFSKKNIIQII